MYYHTKVCEISIYALMTIESISNVTDSNKS